MSLLTLEAKLERQDPSTPWGFRMQGGKDFSSPLSIQRVNPGSLAAKCGLQVGDVILKIGNGDTSVLRHKEAQNSIIAAGNRLDLLLQRGGAPQRGPTGPYETFSTPAFTPGSFQNSGGFNAPQSFNAAPKPFGSQQPSPAPYRPAGFDDGLSQRTQNMSLSPGARSDASSTPSVVSAVPASSSASSTSSVSITPRPPPAQAAIGSDPADLRKLSEKYMDSEEPTGPSQHQSRSFKFLQGLMDSGQEPPVALKTVGPPALQARSVSPAPPENRSGGPLTGPTALVPGSSGPGKVKAIMSQRYNTPIGLYSAGEVMTQFQGQSKFLVNPEGEGQEEEGAGPPAMAPDDLPPPPPPHHHGGDLPLPSPPPPLMEPPGQNGGGAVKYFPSETFKMIQESEQGPGGELEDKTAHSRSFLMLQKHLDSSGAPPPPTYAKPAAPQGGGFQPKPAPPPAAPSMPWSAPAAPAAPPAGPRPFGGGGGGGAPPPAPFAPKPSAGGAKRGRVGEAKVSNPGTGRIPVCSGCGTPIRGPFVTALGNCWCPDHFVCANPQCGVKLIDIGFVEDGGKLYCERDYAQFLAPHCKKCTQAIIGECVNALQSTWHPDCFLCTQCKLPIGGNQFHIEEGKPYCEKDWATMFQTMCAGCEFPIEPGDRWVEAMSKNFHAECFNCNTCQVSLEGQPFVAKAGKAFCKKHAR